MLLLVACTDGTVALGDARVVGVETVPGVVADTGDTGEPDTEPSAEALFSPDTLHVVTLTIEPDAMDRMVDDLYSYVPAELTVDGAVFPDVGVRIKGRLGSLRVPPDKAAFKVDLLELGGTDTLGGLEKINLNNMVQDCAKTHELAAYGIHRLVGLPAARVGYAQLFLNGEDYGVYSLVEDYDDEFLQDNFADASGNLYDGDYVLWRDGSYTLVDFTAQAQAYFELDEGVDVGLADLAAITQAVARATADDFEGVVGPLVDLDQLAAFVAVSAWTGHADSYSYYSNNYRVYLDPARDGRAVFFPWDPDWAFYAGTSVDAPYGVLAQKCLADASCREDVRAAIETLSATVPGSQVQADVEAAVALLEEPLRDDPKLESRMWDVRACQDDQVAWFARRGGELAGWPR
ncbi:MAG: CotH kinase family protein [Myxococcota bacterium]